MLFDPETGTPIALMDGTYVTEARTAGAAALAARLLARDDASVLAILGTGAQARAHAHAFAGVRDWNEVRIAGRDQAKAQELAAELGATASASFEEAVRGADVVAATTHSPEPVVRLEWLSPGTHVSSVGATQVGRRGRPGDRGGSDPVRRDPGGTRPSARRRLGARRSRRLRRPRRAR